MADAAVLSATYHQLYRWFEWRIGKGRADTVQDTIRTDVEVPAKRSARGLKGGGTFAGPRGGTRRRSLPVICLILSDVALALAMWQAAMVLRDLLGHGQLSQIASVSIVPNIVAWIGLRAVLGLYPGYGLDQVEELRRQSFALGATLAIITVFAFASQVGGALSRVLVLGWAVGLLLTAPATRYLTKWVMSKAGLWSNPVVVLGARDVGARVLEALQKEWQLGLRPVGFFDDQPALEGGALGEVPYGQALNDAVVMARKHGFDTAIFAMPRVQREDLAQLMNLASYDFRYVVVIPDLGGIANSSVMARDFAGNLGVEIKHNLLFPWSRRVKRALDLFLTVVGGLLIIPLLVALVVLIKLDSSGPVFYGHRRLCDGDRHFRCWKFRTMHTNAEQLLDEFLQSNPDLRAEWEQNFKLRDDPRVTRVGRFLRKTSLDELPQLWNVVRGEMSLIGPRPIVDAEIRKYGTVYELYRRIKPGISGFWQVSGRSDTDYGERVGLDAYYVNNWSVWLDIVILVRTVRSVILGRGAY